MRPLTARQQRFVEAYDGNATEAARKAGYGQRTPPEKLEDYLRSVGHENLTKPHILEAIKAREEPERKKRIADREERQAMWTSVMRGEGPKGKKPSMRDRLKASELLARSEADFVDRKEVSGPGGGPIPTEATVEVRPADVVAEYEKAIANAAARKAAAAGAGTDGPDGSE